MALAPPYATVPPGPTRTHAGAAGSIVEVTTAGVPAAERLDFWHHAHLGRMELTASSSQQYPFEGRVRRILGADSHLVEHSSDEIVALRSAQQCRRDGVDYVSVNLMLVCGEALIDHRGQHRVQAGSMYVVDSALPVEFRMPRYHCLSLFLPRSKIREAIGPAPLPAGLRTEGPLGVALRNRLQIVAGQAALLSPEARAGAIAACTGIALALLQEAHEGEVGTEQYADALFDAARQIILQHCGDPQLGPDEVAARLGCSRASLYRLFMRHGQSVSSLIWATRLARAHEMIASGRQPHMQLCEVAFRNGFLDQAGFSRMFKKHYGMTPGEVRAVSLARRAVR